MAKAHMQRRLRHTPDNMIELVSDVENYPVFINLIPAVRILSRETISDTQEKFTADVAIKYKMFSEDFRSEVHVDRAKKTLSIQRAGSGGAVKKLENQWKFIELDDGSTLIDFYVNVQLKMPALEFLIRRKFDKATMHIMNEFEMRAAQIYPFVGEENYSGRIGS